MKTNDYIFSSDLALVATLSLWYPIDSIDKSDPSKLVFMFRREDLIDKTIESFWKKELMVEPLTFFNQLKIIKTRIYEH